ncbi:hypothetical protein M0804_002407 [Polistes exclamans]|nr:hypothetical protein M0804_002407 [Polistes exclamans]
MPFSLLMSGKRTRSFKCAVHHRDREVCSENDFHLLVHEPPLFRSATLISGGANEGAATAREFVTRDSIDYGAAGVLIRDCTSSSSSPATWRQEVGGTMCVTATPLSATKIVKDNARQGTRTTATNNNNNITTATAVNITNAQVTQVQGSHGTTTSNVLPEMDRPQHTSIM